MSFSGGSGHSFGGKGSPQKKDRKKKQEFHKHKIKFTEEEHLDFERLKERVSIGLSKLGQQTFSSEPGGYTFHNWMTSFNLLLDDFEERAEPTNLPKDYFDSRQKLTAELLKPADTADLDWEIQNLETEIESVKRHISELTKEANETRDRRRDTASKIDRLEREQVDSERELGEAAEDLDKAKKKQSLFGRLFSGSNSSVDAAKRKVDSLKSRNDEIEENLEELKTASEDPGKEFEGELAVLKEKLESLQQDEAKFIAEKDKKSQLTERRTEATTALLNVISSLKLGTPVQEETADQE